jgi:hypothetical protein
MGVRTLSHRPLGRLLVEEAMGPSDCQTRHARTGARGSLGGSALLRCLK